MKKMWLSLQTQAFLCWSEAAKRGIKLYILGISCEAAKKNTLSDTSVMILAFGTISGLPHPNDLPQS